MRAELQKTISAATREARMRLGLTQEAAAEKVGVSVEYFARIERGNALPSVSALRKLATAMEVSADDLIGTGESLAGGTRSRSLPSQEAGASPPMSPAVTRLVRRLRHAPPGTIRFVSLLVKELEDL